MSVHNGRVATSYADVLARNARARRARLGIDQEPLAERMRALGFPAWRRQTVAAVERSQRRLTAEEVLGLSLALETTVAALMMPVAEDSDIILPSGARLPVNAVQSSVLGSHPTGNWEGDQLKFAPPWGSEQPTLPPRGSAGNITDASRS